MVERDRVLVAFKIREYVSILIIFFVNAKTDWHRRGARRNDDRSGTPTSFFSSRTNTRIKKLHKLNEIERNMGRREKESSTRRPRSSLSLLSHSSVTFLKDKEYLVLTGKTLVEIDTIA